jgi:hypothetical protein
MNLTYWPWGHSWGQTEARGLLTRTIRLLSIRSQSQIFYHRVDAATTDAVRGGTRDQSGSGPARRGCGGWPTTFDRASRSFPHGARGALSRDPACARREGSPPGPGRRPSYRNAPVIRESSTQARNLPAPGASCATTSRLPSVTTVRLPGVAIRAAQGLGHADLPAALAFAGAPDRTRDTRASTTTSTAGGRDVRRPRVVPAQAIIGRPRPWCRGSARCNAFVTVRAMTTRSSGGRPGSLRRGR